jgi:hypothetical protein
MSQLLTSDDLAGILREKYGGDGGTLRLAEVLVEVFGRARPDGVSVSGPVTIQQPAANVPALQVVSFPNATVPAFSGGGGGGGLNPGQVTFPTPPDPAALPIAFSVILYGIVISGSGQDYLVQCFAGDPNVYTALGNFPVKQTQIDPLETIDPLTEVFVWAPINAGNVIGQMRMLYPVFLP